MATKQNLTGEAGAAAKASGKRKAGRPVAARSGKGQRGAGLAVGRDMLIEVTCNLLKTTQPATITRALVARETGVDPSLIRYYFRNRSVLLAAAASRMAERYGQMIEQANVRSDGSPVSLLRERIRALIDLLATYPYFHRLLTEEIMPSSEPEAVEMFRQMTERGTLSYDAILSAGIEQGVFDANINRTMLFTAIIGMSEFYMPGLRVMAEAEGNIGPEAETRAAYTEFVCNLILNGIIRR